MAIVEKPRILVIDDNPGVLLFIEIMLKAQGYDVYIRSSGEDGIESMRIDSPDLVILDLRMPDVDGFEVLKYIREHSDIPVIAYSATPEFSQPALEDGADVFIPKPFDPNRLLGTVEEMIHSRD